MNHQKKPSVEKNSVQNFFDVLSTKKSFSFWEFFRTLIKNQRLQARTSLQIQPINTATFLSILPFLFGFLQFIHQKYNFSKTPLILEKNIPAVRVPTEKLEWETIEYLQNQDKLASTFSAGKVYWSDTTLLCQTVSKKEKNSVFFKSENSITSLETSKKSTGSSSIISGISAKNSFFVSQTMYCNKIEEFYGNLDELPKKLESIFPISNTTFKNQTIAKQKKRVINFSDPFLNQKDLTKNNGFTTTPVFPIISTPSNFKNSQTSKSSLNGLSNSFVSTPMHENAQNLKKSQPSSLQKNVISLQNKTETVFSSHFKPQSTSPILKIRETFLQKFDSLVNEYHSFFFKTGQIPNFKSASKKNSIVFSKIIEKNKSLEADERKILSLVLEDVNALIVQDEFFSPRRMSGYLFPDMNSIDVGWFLLQKYISSSGSVQNIQIQLPASFSLLKQYSTLSLIKPDFLIETKNVHLKNRESDNTLYQGPAITTLKQTGFDWNIRSKNSENYEFRDWLEFYLSSVNPFSDSFLNFFGVYNSPEYDVSAETNIQKDSNYWFSQLPFFRNGILSNPDTSLLSFERSFQIPFISEKEWNRCFPENTQNLTNDLAEKDFVEISLPLVETRIPTNKEPFFLFGLQPLVDYQFSPPYKNKSYVQGDFLPEIWDSLEEESFGNQISSGMYQRIPSTFQLKSQDSKNIFFDPSLFFYDLWEPLTYRSWLVISQIGFAFLVFSILKALADNYGRELLVYLLDLVALLGFLDEDLKQEIEILMGQREKGFRIISKTTKSFKDIAGIEKLLPEIIEIVWFLRNSARDFSLSKTLPRGVLLTGPPGTGKTLLVQALAGEASVPVLALSGSSLIEPGESGALKLEILFQEARKLAPCIVFIDEMDTLAEKRQQVLQNPMGADELLESLHGSQNRTEKQKELQQILLSNAESSVGKDDGNESENLLAHQDMQREKLRILMQFLVELDGIQGRDGVIVIGATNRPEMLDPAILRPGRFDRIVELGLPGPEKRKEILKLYSKNLGIHQNVSWDYLANRTAGFSAADLASIMNQSSLKAITLQTQHTIETIEHGIDRITTFEVEKPKNISQDHLSLLRRGYYQAGKIILSMVLEHHPPTLVTYLWPRRTNVRALQISSNVQKYFFKYARRIELEHRLIGCYAGKAAEILFIEFGQSTSSEINVSDLGVEDIQFAQNLIQFMTDTWYLYSKKTTLRKILNIAENRNTQEYRDGLGKLQFFETLNSGLESRVGEQNFAMSDINDPNSTELSNTEIPVDQQSQSYFSVPWWQYQVSTEFEIATRTFADWYRLYLPDPQETERNLEWSPPDEFYQANSSLQYLTKSINWNTLDSITTEYQTHSLVLQSFNTALNILEEHRELLDKIAYELIQNEILREPEIEIIFEKFNLLSTQKNHKTSFAELAATLANTVSLSSDSGMSQKKFINKSWGQKSRRKYARWINLQEIQTY